MRTALLLPLAATLLVSACASFANPVEKPDVSVRAVSVGSVSFTGLEGRIDFDVFNPNAFGLPLESCEFSLAVGGDRAVSGRFDLSDTIPARASAPVAGTIRIDPVAAARVGARLAAGERRYRVTGTLRFATRFGSVDVRFSADGELAS
jgi:LEA14-like dessication related protein